ncbi:hypothetical protein HK096_001362, partial [Nowakowskiella sp. JEL0078]
KQLFIILETDSHATVDLTANAEEVAHVQLDRALAEASELYHGAVCLYVICKDKCIPICISFIIDIM